MAHELAVAQFASRLQRALEQVRIILNSAKAPCFAGEVHHQYEDKYLLAECLTNTAAASQLNCLSNLGLSADQVRQLRDWAKTSNVSLRLRAEERCNFDREETREVESPTQRVEELSIGGAVAAAVTSKVVTKVTEYFWKVEASWELLVVRGVGEQPADRVSIFSRTGRTQLKTNTKHSPRPETSVPAVNVEVNISWLLRQLPSDALTPSFSVDRSHKNCHTPRRNPDVDAAFAHFGSMGSWALQVAYYLESLLRIQPDPSRKFDMSALCPDAVLVPVLPLLRESEEEEGAPTAEGSAEAGGAQTLACLPSSTVPQGSALLSAGETNRLLAEEARTLTERRAVVHEAFPSGDMLATAAEAGFSMMCRHCDRVCKEWAQAVEYIERLLRKQLIAAIGKEVTPADFAEYMRFHNRKLFAQAYAPTPFCFAVRRSELHAPEGTVSIEEEVVGPRGDSNIAAPIVTIAARSARPHLMHFPLSASTNVFFGGDRYLHAWLSHKFSEQSGSKLSLVSRARQFSSMLVLVGRIASASTFEPKYAAIVQNKDDLTIPLDMSTIPTPKEFKDAIESLSAEQQAFAKAFRAMQLESTLFGVLIIQIKPQLEKVLNLPADSLTKEIKLTQDLMQLFIKYQIPSDLLSFDGSIGTEGAELIEATASERLEAVRGHVEAIHKMIAEAREEEVSQRRMEESYARPRKARLQMDEYVLECAAVPVPMMAMAAAPAPVMAMAAAPVPMARMAAAPSPMAGAAVPPSVPPAPALAAGQPQHPQQPHQPQQEQADAADGVAFDYTQVPREMDKQFERMDSDGALRPTIISPSDRWTKRAQKALLASPTTSVLHSDEQKREKDAAFDLLDALTKSGSLPVDHISLHIVVAATHCFDKSVTETVVQDNVNPIDKVERSTLIMAMTVHQQPAAALIQQAQYPRVSSASPVLFLENATE
eukprot:CAMPEP_0179039872 /NCGR_PEP_ID=MMETSP0796-20121207/15359_1 /TAXON_ID=73915 /ORGANISM="Pyrodinium bahamense, Strain pbaha01" /LENGTH=936 /DNA_ID=CAMNT_0020736207 /DNA_START=64 /DNA_END=2874 /DNA_ORIENTATION=-